MWSSSSWTGTRCPNPLGNYYTLGDLVDQGFRPMAIRHQLMSAHYRKQLNFTLDGLRQSEAAMQRLETYIWHLAGWGWTLGVGKTAEVAEIVDRASAKFRRCLDDDLNVPGALGAVFEVVGETNPMIARGEFPRW